MNGKKNALPIKQNFFSCLEGVLGNFGGGVSKTIFQNPRVWTPGMSVENGPHGRPERAHPELSSPSPQRGEMKAGEHETPPLPTATSSKDRAERQVPSLPGGDCIG